MQGSGISQYSTSITAPNLPAGNHSLKIRAQGGSYDFNNFFIIDGYSQVYFTVSDNSTQTNHSNQTTSVEPTSIPNPTDSPKPTISPTSNQSIASDYWRNSAAITAIVIGIVIVAIASISLVYFRRRKGKP